MVSIAIITNWLNCLAELYFLEPRPKLDDLRAGKELIGAAAATLIGQKTGKWGRCDHGLDHSSQL